MISSVSKTKKILIVEDESHIAEILRFNLQQSGFEVILAEDGEQGILDFYQHHPDLVVLDLMLPKIEGIDVILKIRSTHPLTPILVLSAKDQVKEKVRCLNAGVDDYLSKPFHLEEFLARVNRILVRSHTSLDSLDSDEPKGQVRNFDLYQFSDAVVDFKNFRGVKNGHEFPLTAQELKLLKVFFQFPQKVFTREELLKLAWGYGPLIQSRTLDNFIVRFRKYFEDDPKIPRFFKSIRSVGYVFDKDGELQ